VTGTFRVLLEMHVTPAHAAEFEAAWSDVARSVSANPANLGQALMRSCDRPGQYHVLTDWTDEAAFRSFERSAEHVGHRARLAPYRTGVTMTTTHIVAELPAHPDGVHGKAR
jgi:heme-degrading monooxygenase HmoA